MTGPNANLNKYRPHITLPKPPPHTHTHSLTHSLTHSPTHSLTHSLPHTLTLIHMGSSLVRLPFLSPKYEPTAPPAPTEVRVIRIYHYVRAHLCTVVLQADLFCLLQACMYIYIYILYLFIYLFIYIILYVYKHTYIDMYVQYTHTILIM